MVWKNRRVLVTGAGGFIGSHLTEELPKALKSRVEIARMRPKHSEVFGFKSRVSLHKADVYNF